MNLVSEDANGNRSRNIYSSGTLPVPLARPLLPATEAVTPYLDRMHNMRWYSNNGPLSREFQDRLATLLGVPTERIVLFPSATAGLHACFSLKKQIGEWHTPGFSFVATWLAAHQATARQIFLDVDPTNWAIEPPRIALRRNKGLVDVRPFGAGPADDLIYEGYESVIVDAAASIISFWQAAEGLLAGINYVFSLHASKIVSTGEGGFVVAENEKFAQQLRQWANFGFDLGREPRQAGFNGKLSEINCAYGLASLDAVESLRLQWSQISHESRRIEDSLGLVGLPRLSRGIGPYWVIDCGSPETRERVREGLEAAGFEGRAWWQSAASVAGFLDMEVSEPLPESERLAKSHLGLPFFLGIGTENLSRIGHTIATAIRRAHGGTTK